MSTILSMRATALEHLGRREEALVDRRRSIDEFERLRTGAVETDAMKLAFVDQGMYLYEGLLALQVKTNDPSAALQTGERARARAFVDLLATRASATNEIDQLGVDARVPDDKPNVAPADGLLTRGGGETRLDTDARQPENLELESRAASTPLTSSEIAAIVERQDSTVVSFWVGPRVTYAWVFSPRRSVRVLAIDVSSARLTQLVRETWTGRSSGSPVRGDAEPSEDEWVPLTRGADTLSIGENHRVAFRELYELLIAPIRSDFPRGRAATLTIVPHGPLFRLSFAALQDPRGRYLIEDYALHYTPSIAALQFTVGTKASGSGGYLFVADPALPAAIAAAERLTPLPGPAARRATRGHSSETAASLS